ncbi:nitrite/sulfite reductase [Denitratisoma sp. agr-D3]
MYLYDEQDQQLVEQRVAQFRGQMQRHLAGKLAEDDFRPLRLQNGLYVQRHAPMLRVAIPYGMVSSRQLRVLARIAREYDRGYGHFTTRQNVQFNWPRLEDAPEILAQLAQVQMHAIQTSGNCIRNVTTDALAGVAPDETVDPRPYCELLRQWSTLNPEFAYLPRKFKIAVSGATGDRAATAFHDIGARALRNEAGEIGFCMLVGGGMGRTPMVGQVVRDFLPRAELFNYCEAILRVYNQYGRRDNKYKARIKILLKELGLDQFRREVEAEWQHLRGGSGTIAPEAFARIEVRFSQPVYDPAEAAFADPVLPDEPAFRQWLTQNVQAHRVPGYAIVTLSLKAPDSPPGDLTADQMDGVAQLAERYSQGEVRASHEQNLVLADVPRRRLYDLWQEATALKLATANAGLLTDMICCPGGDFCSLANARSLPVAEAIVQRFANADELRDIGPLRLNVSGCVNACGHHHVGHIGILGVDKNGEERFQVSLGGHDGSGNGKNTLGRIVGPSFAATEMPRVIAQLTDTYRRQRQAGETFIDTCQRTGIEPFRQDLYGDAP